MPRVKLIPGKPLGSNWLWCGLCVVQVKRADMVRHDNEHAELFGRYSRQSALDRVIPVVYDDMHYGLMEPDVAQLHSRFNV